jgi:hypothetical protein
VCVCERERERESARARGRADGQLRCTHYSWIKLKSASELKMRLASMVLPSMVYVTNVVTAVTTGIEKNIKRFNAMRRSAVRMRASSTVRSSAILLSIDCSQLRQPITQ